MAQCGKLSTFTLDLCQGSLGGIREIYIADYKADAATVDETTKTVTAFDSSVNWLKVPIRKNTASLTSTLSQSDENGYSWNSELTINFGRIGAATRLSVQGLILTDSMIIAVDANGTKIFLGQDNPVTAGSGDAQTGTAKTDANRYQLVMSDDSVEAPYIISPECVINVQE